MKTNQSTNWREKYIKILLNGPEKSEYVLAVELIEAGYAKGRALKNSDGTGDPYINVLWQGPTTQGREYLDKLQTKVKRESIRFRVLAAAWSFGVWLVGLVSGPAISWVLGL